MDIISIAQEIQFKIKQLEKGRGELYQRAHEKAQAVAEYERDLAVEILKLKASDVPTTIVEKIARGNIWEKRLAMEESEAILKAAYVKMNSLETELSALQSLFRHLKEM